MNNIDNKKLLKNRVSSMIISFAALGICSWSFWQNNLLKKIFILPLIICLLAVFFKNLFLIVDKPKTSNFFKKIYIYTILTYIIGAWLYFFIYAIFNDIPLLITLIIFTLFAIPTIKTYYKKMKK